MAQVNIAGYIIPLDSDEINDIKFHLEEFGCYIEEVGVANYHIHPPPPPPVYIH